MSSQPSSKTIQRAAFAVMAAVALVTFIIGFMRNREAMKPYAACTASAEGIVTSVETNTNSDGKTEYSPAIKYETGGAEYFFTVSPTLTVYSEGEKMTVRYDPDDPFMAYAEEEPPSPGSDMYIISATCLLIGVISLFVKPRRRRIFTSQTP